MYKRYIGKKRWNLRRIYQTRLLLIYTMVTPVLDSICLIEGYRMERK